MPTKKNTKSSTTHMSLPKPVRDELRMSVALRGYSALKAGRGKTIKQQIQSLYDFFHGKKKHSPSQIQMLVEGQLHYACFYEKESVPISTKKTKSSKKQRNNATERFFLKKALTCVSNRIFVQNVDITVKDLEKKLLRGPDTVNGRQLLAMAKKGLQEYRKALSFTNDKWDLKKMNRSNRVQLLMT